MSSLRQSNFEILRRALLRLGNHLAAEAVVRHDLQGP